MSWFAGVEQVPPIEVFILLKQFNEDPYPQKVSLGVGAYRTVDSKPWVLPVVRIAEKTLANDETLDKEYLPVLGLETFCSAATRMLLGENSPVLKDNKKVLRENIAIIYRASNKLRNVKPPQQQSALVSKIVKNIVKENHRKVFLNAGFEEPREYRYWSAQKKGLDIEGFLEDLRNAPEESVIILHACAHNPTGCDPTKEQWVQIAQVMKERKLFPFFDSAYQGFASGDLDKDAWAVRYFVEQGFELFCSQSFAKNFGLYNERIGNLVVVLQNPQNIPAVKSQFTILIRTMYSNPPSHGARIVSYVLNNPELYNQWKDNIRTMSSRISDMRKLLRDELEKLNTPGDWSHITSQIGMFSYTGLNEIQSEHMVKKHHVYMLRSGRISIAGVTPSNVEYVAKAIHETLTSLQ